ncbi:MAG: hypothetical protein ACRED5_21640 [Propylenella sp.]
MTYRSAGTAALIAAISVAACQSYEVQAPQRTPMDGRWASSDGVFIADFQRGSFTSRFVQTNEILAQGTYTVSGANVSLRWLSVQAQEQRAANCTFTSADLVSCQQEGGGNFNLQRTA